MSIFRAAVTRFVPWSGSTVGIYFLAVLIEIKVSVLLVSGLEFGLVPACPGALSLACLCAKSLFVLLGFSS